MVSRRAIHNRHRSLLCSSYTNSLSIHSLWSLLWSAVMQCKIGIVKRKERYGCASVTTGWITSRRTCRGRRSYHLVNYEDDIPKETKSSMTRTKRILWPRIYNSSTFRSILITTIHQPPTKLTLFRIPWLLFFLFMYPFCQVFYLYDSTRRNNNQSLRNTVYNNSLIFSPFARCIECNRSLHNSLPLSTISINHESLSWFQTSSYGIQHVTSQRLNSID